MQSPEVMSEQPAVPMTKLELLAPAGSLDICKAVINAGADAVYLGGKQFSARAYAGNLSTDEIFQALDFAHLRGVDIYLTLNTLIKENEINEVIPFLKELADAGLDAVIVQDFGCMSMIRSRLPQLSVHASTQMAVMTHFFAERLKELGVKRVVLPREMTLHEIKSIYDKTGIELEAFVHGALCYSYSGQCLFSSTHGQRSGNRGSCAQPCRLMYRTGKEKGRFLCTKDIAALELIPRLAGAGVKSLKIEGRMKNVYYAAGVTSIYRKYTDKYYSGEEIFDSDELKEDLKKLAALYNRGSFSPGMFSTVKGKALMSLDRPNNRGVAALKVLNNKKGHITFRATEDINRGDVFEINTGNSFTSGKNILKGNTFDMNLPAKHGIKEGQILYRMNDSALQDEISEKFIKKNKKIHVEMKLTAKSGRPALLEIYHPGCKASVSVSGEMIQKAKNAGVSAGELEKRLCKLGTTDFECRQAVIDADSEIFISNGGVNELRRNGLSLISKEIINKHESRKKCTKSNFLFANNKKNDIIGGSVPEKLVFSALINDSSQLGPVIEGDTVSRLYIPVSLVRKEKGVYELLKGREFGDKELFIALPVFFRERHTQLLKKDIEIALSVKPDGFLVRGADQICALAKYVCPADIKKAFKIVTDYQVYSFNSSSVRFLADLINESGFSPDLFTAPTELKAEEISDIGLSGVIEAVGYGRRMLMQSEHCIKKTLGSCTKDSTPIIFSDEKEEQYLAVTDCRYCNNIIYDHHPVNIIGELKASTDIKRIRIDLTDETKEDTENLLDSLASGRYGDIRSSYTAGFNTGVL